MKSVALFGGSFDPPHLGHIAIVKQALEQLDIEKLIIVPAYLNPFKSSSCAPSQLRLSWLRRIFDGFSRIEVSDFETSHGRPVSTFETVSHFRMLYEKIYLIIGADNLASLEKWHRFDELDAMVTWVVAERSGIAIAPHYMRLDVDVPLSSTQLRAQEKAYSIDHDIEEEIAHYYKEHYGKTYRENKSRT